MVINYATEIARSTRELVKQLNTINNYYNCPEECSGWCCKMSPIAFGHEEYYNILSKVDKKTKVIIRAETEPCTNPCTNLPKVVKEKMLEFSFRQFKTATCPLLDESDKCGIHDYRPNMCRIYPFHFEHLSTYGFVHIEPCPMGIDIAFDYLNMLASELPSETKYTSFQTQALNEAYQVYKDRLNNNKRTGTKAFKIIDAKVVLPKFICYLKGTPKSLRLESRTILLDQAKKGLLGT